MQTQLSVGVIGAGPAGLMAAIHAKTPYTRVTLIDKQSQIGGKIVISGSGQCNYAHKMAYQDYLKCYGDNGKFLSHIFKGFFVHDAIAFFERLGIASVIMPNGKIFPASKNAKDIIHAYEMALKKNNIKTKLSTAVSYIVYQSKQWCVNTLQNQTMNFDILVIATGGASFQHLGTTGDAVNWMESLKLSCIPLNPVLTGITSSSNHEKIAGLTFKKATIDTNGKQKVGELLITHKGFSGPVIHNISRYTKQGSSVYINWLSLDANVLKQKIIKASEQNGSETVVGFLTSLTIPKRLLNYILTDKLQHTQLAELSKKNRQMVITALTKYKIINPQLIGFKSAMVTSGGLALSELNKKNCLVKSQPNLYAIGEVIDIDGDTGGFNIMAAMSMGVAAGKNIASLSIASQ